MHRASKLPKAHAASWSDVQITKTSFFQIRKGSRLFILDTHQHICKSSTPACFFLYPPGWCLHQLSCLGMFLADSYFVWEGLLSLFFAYSASYSYYCCCLPWQHMHLWSWTLATAQTSEQPLFLQVLCSAAAGPSTHSKAEMLTLRLKHLVAPQNKHNEIEACWES